MHLFSKPAVWRACACTWFFNTTCMHKIDEVKKNRRDLNEQLAGSNKIHNYFTPWPSHDTVACVDNRRHLCCEHMEGAGAEIHGCCRVTQCVQARRTEGQGRQI